MSYLNFIVCIELQDVLLIRVHYYADHDYLNETFHIDILEKRAVHTWNFSLLRIFYRIVNGMCLFETSLYFFFANTSTRRRGTLYLPIPVSTRHLGFSGLFEGNILTTSTGIEILFFL